jgi:hypothetical protein
MAVQESCTGNTVVGDAPQSFYSAGINLGVAHSLGLLRRQMNVFDDVTERRQIKGRVTRPPPDFCQEIREPIRLLTNHDGVLSFVARVVA